MYLTWHKATSLPTDNAVGLLILNLKGGSCATLGATLGDHTLTPNVTAVSLHEKLPPLLIFIYVVGQVYWIIRNSKQKATSEKHLFHC